MQYLTAGYSAIGQMIMPLDSEEKLERAICERAQIDYMERSTSGATTIAHLIIQDDDSYRFEGIAGNRTLTPSTSVPEAMREWSDFVIVQQERHEADKARWRSGSKATTREG